MAISERALNYLNNYAKKQKPRFLLFHSIWQRFAFWEEGEFAPLHIMCAPKKGAKSGETVVEPTVCRRAMVSPSNHGKPEAVSRRGFRESKRFKARLKTMLFKKRTQIAAYLRLLRKD